MRHKPKPSGQLLKMFLMHLSPRTANLMDQAIERDRLSPSFLIWEFPQVNKELNLFYMELHSTQNCLPRLSPGQEPCPSA